MEGLSSAGLSDEDEEMPRAFEVPTVVEELEEVHALWKYEGVNNI